MDTFVARQPIFDRSQRVVAYELLFRSGPENYFSGHDTDTASSSVISDSVHVFDHQALTGGKKAYVNVSRSTLLEGFPTLLPPETTVVELLETVDPDEEVMAACAALKKLGYTLALDDFVFRPGFENLVPYVDVIKVDLVSTTKDTREALYREFSPTGIRFLAEKVETREEFEHARNLGYEYFQGYFICRPEVISRRGISAAKRSTLHLLQEINRPDLDYGALERTIQQDPALTLKLLRYLNSAFFAAPAPIKSIMHGLRVLGDGPLRVWASLVALGALAGTKSSELSLMSLIRARFCETAGVRAKCAAQGNELFLMGMISTFDALLDVPLEEVLAEMSLSSDIVAALTGSGGPLAPLYQLVRSLERGEWVEATARRTQVGLADPVISELYTSAVAWADSVQGL